jgi:triosephosphate isomerase
MKKLMIGNWKMNMVQEEARTYLNAFCSAVANSEHTIAICFPYTLLSLASQMLFGKNVLVGAQNVHQEEGGAHTGEISAKMLKDFSCEYVLVGHSERREHFFEKNKIINSKIKVLLKYGIKPVLCVGENQKEREENKTKQVIKTQIEQALAGLYENELKSLVIAYEPVWAIGTGKNANAKQVIEVIKYIRECVEHLFSAAAAKNLQILYGGSVKPENAKSYLSNSEVNGLLVGGASLNAQSFAKIICD